MKFLLKFSIIAAVCIAQSGAYYECKQDVVTAIEQSNDLDWANRSGKTATGESLTGSVETMADIAMTQQKELYKKMEGKDTKKNPQPIEIEHYRIPVDATIDLAQLNYIYSYEYLRALINGEHEKKSVEAMIKEIDLWAFERIKEVAGQNRTTQDVKNVLGRRIEDAFDKRVSDLRLYIDGFQFEKLAEEICDTTTKTTRAQKSAAFLKEASLSQLKTVYWGVVNAEFTKSANYNEESLIRYIGTRGAVPAPEYEKFIKKDLAEKISQNKALGEKIGASGTPNEIYQKLENDTPLANKALAEYLQTQMLDPKNLSPEQADQLFALAAQYQETSVIKHLISDHLINGNGNVKEDKQKLQSWLLARGSLHEGGQNGQTMNVLMWASKNGDKNLFEYALMVAKKAFDKEGFKQYLTAQDGTSEQKTVLMHLIENKKADQITYFMNVLEEAGLTKDELASYLEKQDSNGSNALMSAVALTSDASELSKKLSLCQYMMSKVKNNMGTDRLKRYILSVDNEGQNALMLSSLPASRGGMPTPAFPSSKELCQYLVSEFRGILGEADMNKLTLQTDKQGRNIWLRAGAWETQEFAQYFAELGDKLDAESKKEYFGQIDSHGWSILTYAGANRQIGSYLIDKFKSIAKDVLSEKEVQKILLTEDTGTSNLDLSKGHRNALRIALVKRQNNGVYDYPTLLNHHDMLYSARNLNEESVKKLMELANEYDSLKEMAEQDPGEGVPSALQIMNGELELHDKVFMKPEAQAAQESRKEQFKNVYAHYHELVK